MEQLRQEKLEIDQQLRAIQGSSMGSMQSFPVSRRSDRGNSSDIDSGNRSGRVGYRLRGRGRGGAGSGGGMGGNSRYHPGNNIHNDNEQSNYINNINDQKKVNQRGNSRGNGRASRGSGVDRNPDRTSDRRPPRPNSASTSSTPK